MYSYKTNQSGGVPSLFGTPPLWACFKDFCAQNRTGVNLLAF